MPALSTCPAAEQFEQLLQGRLPFQGAESLADHLEQCNGCGEMVDRLVAADDLAAAVRTPTPTDRGVLPAEVSGLIERLQGSRPTIARGTTPAAAPNPCQAGTLVGDVSPATLAEFQAGMGTTVAPQEGTPGPDPDAALLLEVCVFLGPAQGADELGRLGSYRVVKILGAGGMGIVFLAEDPHLQRRVALKVMRPALAASASARQRFMREARAIAAIDHDHIVTIYQVGEDRGVPFLAMHFLQGETLDHCLKRRPKPAAASVLRVGREIAAGLAAAHQRGLIHRDIKPSNIWLEESGRVKILDFGLVRAATEEPSFTPTALVVGTPAFMAPEQAAGRPVDASCDLFSLGCVLYRMCTGTLPFKGADMIATLMAVATDTPPSPHELDAEVPRALSDLVMCLLAKDPADRPQSAAGVIEALQAIEAGLSAATKPVAVPPGAQLPSTLREILPTHPRSSRRRFAAAAVAALLLGAAGVAALMVLRVETSKGTLEIVTADPAVKIHVEQNGELITIIDPESRQQIELKAGAYQLKLGEGGQGLELNTDHFTLTRGGKKLVTIKRLEPAAAQARAPAAASSAVNDAWLKAVAAMPPGKQVEAVARKLHDLNPGFDGKVTFSRFANGVVIELGLLTDGVTDLTPVRALTGLRNLTCTGSQPGKGKLADLAPLTGLSLTSLTCHGNQVSDLSPLRGMRLTLLNCGETKVSDLSPLQGMPLRLLVCTGTAVSDLSYLKGMPLQELSCTDTQISDLLPLTGLPLTSLRCDGTEVKDLTPLKGMALTHLWCQHTRVSDLAPLKGMPLEELNCGATAVADLKPLQGMPLTYLACGETKVTDLTPLKGMRLTAFACSGIGVSTLAALTGMPLRELTIPRTKVADLSPLKEMALIDLVIEETPVADLSPLAGMPLTRLIMGNTKVADLSPLRGMPLKKLTCDFQPDRDAQILRSIKTLESINAMAANKFWQENGNVPPSKP